MAISLSIPGGVVQLSGNPIWCNVTGGAVPVGATGYKILLKITSLDGVLAGGPFVDAITPTALGAATFDVSGYVDQAIDPTFEWPLVNSVHAYIDAAYNVSIQSGEHYVNSSGVLVETYAATAQNIQIVKGHITDRQIGEYNDAATSFFAEVIEKCKFLTNQPDNMLVAPDQPVKLWLVSPYAANTNMVLYVTGHYADATSEMITQPFEIFQDGIFEFTVNPTHVGIPAHNTEGSQLVKFGVAVVNPADGFVGDSRTYWVNNDYQENSNFLFAANAYGCVDVIWLTGSVKITTDVSGTEGVRAMAQGASARTRSMMTTSRSGRKKYTINTGWKPETELAGLEDVYLSKHLWLLYNGKLIPVSLANGEQLLADTMEDLHSVDLELVEG